MLVRDGDLCQVCFAADRLTVANEVDHIASLARGGSDDESNLQAICSVCHQRRRLLVRTIHMRNECGLGIGGT